MREEREAHDDTVRELKQRVEAAEDAAGTKEIASLRAQLLEAEEAAAFLAAEAGSATTPEEWEAAHLSATQEWEIAMRLLQAEAEHARLEAKCSSKESENLRYDMGLLHERLTRSQAGGTEEAEGLRKVRSRD